MFFRYLKFLLCFLNIYPYICKDDRNNKFLKLRINNPSGRYPRVSLCVYRTECQDAEFTNIRLEIRMNKTDKTASSYSISKKSADIFVGYSFPIATTNLSLQNSTSIQGLENEIFIDDFSFLLSTYNRFECQIGLKPPRYYPQSKYSIVHHLYSKNLISKLQFSQDHENYLYLGGLPENYNKKFKFCQINSDSWVCLAQFAGFGNINKDNYSKKLFSSNETVEFDTEWRGATLPKRYYDQVKNYLEKKTNHRCVIQGTTKSLMKCLVSVSYDSDEISSYSYPDLDDFHIIINGFKLSFPMNDLFVEGSCEKYNLRNKCIEMWLELQDFNFLNDKFTIGYNIMKHNHIIYDFENTRIGFELSDENNDFSSVIEEDYYRYEKIDNKTIIDVPSGLNANKKTVIQLSIILSILSGSLSFIMMIILIFSLFKYKKLRKEAASLHNQI
jgi:hypothetical protein